MPQLSVDRARGLPLRSAPAPDSKPSATFDPTTLPLDTYTLYKAAIGLQPGTTSIRVFFWHQNLYGADIGWVVSASTVGGEQASISNAKKAIWDPADALSAMCVAAATMYQTMDSFAPFTSNLNQTEAGIYGKVIPSSGGVAGGCIQFDLTCSSATTLQVRTSATNDTSGFSLLGSYGDDCAWPWQEGAVVNGAQTYLEHQRGWWPYSWVVMPITPDFDVKGVQLQQGQQKPHMNVWVFKSNAGCPELDVNGGFGLQPADTWGSMQGNKGRWGAKLSYDFTFVNTASDNNTYGGQAWLSAPSAPQPPSGADLPFWTGACDLETPSGYMQGQVPSLQLYAPLAGGSSSPGSSVIAEVSLDSTSGQDLPIVVARGQSVPVRVSLMTGGDSELPVILQVVNTLNSTQGSGGG